MSLLCRMRPTVSDSELEDAGDEAYRDDGR